MRHGNVFSIEKRNWKFEKKTTTFLRYVLNVIDFTAPTNSVNINLANQNKTMKTVKLIIAKTENQTVYFNHGDDYSDITRVLVEDHSPWEEMDDDDLYLLQDFVKEFNFNSRKRKGEFAFLVEKESKISAQSAIKSIVEKRETERKRYEEEERKRKEEYERKKIEKEMKKEAKTKEQKRLLLEKLKKELGE